MYMYLLHSTFGRRPSSSLSQKCDSAYSTAAACVDDITLLQFINNSSDHLTNDTRLIFSPGNHSLELELVVKSIHTFSMFAWPGSTSMQGLNLGIIAAL